MTANSRQTKKARTKKKTEMREAISPTEQSNQAVVLKEDVNENAPQIYLPVVRNIQTNDFYIYLGENKFQNIRTKAEGEVPTDKASTLFRINIDATKLFNEFPLVNDLVNKLNLTFDNSQKQ